MKYLYKIILTVSLLLTVACQAQIMSTLKDAKKLKENETKFIGKPLKKLLREIKPEIRMASAQSNRPDHQPSVMFFKFVDDKEYYKNENKRSFTTIIVYIKENFDWDVLRNTKIQKYTWSKEDEKIFGNLTIIGLGVLGDK